MLLRVYPAVARVWSCVLPILSYFREEDCSSRRQPVALQTKMNIVKIDSGRVKQSSRTLEQNLSGPTPSNIGGN